MHELEQEGVIIKSDFGFFTFDGIVEPYLALEIQMFDGCCTTMRFDVEKTKKILKQFLPHYTGQFVSNLVGVKVWLLDTSFSHVNQAPIAIRTFKDDWIFKDNYGE